eukprot:scaffold201055_cov29-Tisochrysis_lutea.AAC.15
MEGKPGSSGCARMRSAALKPPHVFRSERHGEHVKGERCLRLRAPISHEKRVQPPERPLSRASNHEGRLVPAADDLCGAQGLKARQDVRARAATGAPAQRVGAPRHLAQQLVRDATSLPQARQAQVRQREL